MKKDGPKPEARDKETGPQSTQGLNRFALDDSKGALLSKFKTKRLNSSWSH